MNFHSSARPLTAATLRLFNERIACSLGVSPDTSPRCRTQKEPDRSWDDQEKEKAHEPSRSQRLGSRVAVGHRAGRAGAGRQAPHSERVAIANSRDHLNTLKARVRADGHVSLWERMRVRSAEAHLKALV